MVETTIRLDVNVHFAKPFHVTFFDITNAFYTNGKVSNKTHHKIHIVAVLELYVGRVTFMNKLCLDYFYDRICMTRKTRM